MPYIDKNIADLFIAAAEKTAETDRAETARRQKEFREGIKKLMGPIVDDFERELEPVLLAIAALPGKDGIHVTLEASFGINSKLSIIRETKDSRKTNVFDFEAYTGPQGEPYLRLQYEETAGDKSSAVPENPGPKDFAEAREKLAAWFAHVAPERIADLKALMLPDEAHAAPMALENAVHVAPLRLKSSAP